jgi:hypothetical protein
MCLRTIINQEVTQPRRRRRDGVCARAVLEPDFILRWSKGDKGDTLIPEWYQRGFFSLRREEGDRVRYSMKTIARCAVDDNQPGGLHVSEAIWSLEVMSTLKEKYACKKEKNV